MLEEVSSAKVFETGRCALMNELPFVDAYVHFCDPSIPGLRYSWLEEDARHPYLGEALERLKGESHLLDRYLEDARTSNVIAAVHVEAATGTEDRVNETEWLQGLAARTGFPQAIVAYADLREPGVEDLLSRHRRSPNLRGIRSASVSESDALLDPQFQRGYALLKQFDLAGVISVRPADIHKARDLALRFPDIPMALIHCAFPWDRTGDDYFDDWRRDLESIARVENVVCTISGLPVCDHDWTIESLRPWVLACVEAFGPSRCMFGSHWPVDMLFSTYDRLIDAYAKIIANFTLDERMDLLSRNALNFYRVLPS